MSVIDKKSLEHLAELARIKLSGKEEEKMLTDLKKILTYFEELKEADTLHVEPLTGGTELTNIAREDAPRGNDDTGKGRAAFPEEEGRFLKIPPMNL